jgi:hypothetical protein
MRLIPRRSAAHHELLALMNVETVRETPEEVVIQEA